jgi:hypothetical protein
MGSRKRDAKREVNKIRQRRRIKRKDKVLKWRNIIMGGAEQWREMRMRGRRGVNRITGGEWLRERRVRINMGDWVIEMRVNMRISINQRKK